uniref:Uncharacterized protein n=1 Tax=Glycine max TaxID=3847 RepID=A0A0R0LFR4_SOYBN
MEKNEETTMEEKVKQKINGGLRSTYLKLLCFDYHLIKLVVLRLPLHNKNNSSAIAHPTLFHFPHSFTPSLSPYQNAQCNARRSRASSQHAIPYSRPWLGLLLGAAHSLGGHGRANHNLTGPFDLGVKFDGDIAGPTLQSHGHLEFFMIRRHSSASHCRCWRFPCLFGILSSYGLKTSQFSRGSPV